MLNFKIFVARLLTCPLMGRFISYLYKNQIPSRGMVFDTSSSYIAPTTTAALFWKTYESAEIRFIQEYLPEELDVLELGSSIGVLSCFIRKRLCKEARLICVEAHPDLTQHIPLNLKLNELLHNVYILNKAIDYEQANSVYFSPGESCTTGKVTGTKLRPPGSISVRRVTLSSLISAFQIDNYVLVADIEGHEIQIIRRDKEALNNCQHLFIELHPTVYEGHRVSADDMLKELVDTLGFDLRDRYGNVVYLTRNKKLPAR